MLTNVKAVANLVQTREDAEALIRELTNRFELDGVVDVDTSTVDVMEVHRLLVEAGQRALLSDDIGLFNFLNEFRTELPTAALALGVPTDQGCVDTLLHKVQHPGWKVRIVVRTMRGRQIAEVATKLPLGDSEFSTAVEAWEWAKIHGRSGFTAELYTEDERFIIRKQL